MCDYNLNLSLYFIGLDHVMTLIEHQVRFTPLILSFFTFQNKECHKNVSFFPKSAIKIFRNGQNLCNCVKDVT